MFLYYARALALSILTLTGSLLYSAQPNKERLEELRRRQEVEEAKLQMQKERARQEFELAKLQHQQKIQEKGLQLRGYEREQGPRLERSKLEGLLNLTVSQGLSPATAQWEQQRQFTQQQRPAQQEFEGMQTEQFKIKAKAEEKNPTGTPLFYTRTKQWISLRPTDKQWYYLTDKGWQRAIAGWKPYAH